MGLRAMTERTQNLKISETPEYEASKEQWENEYAAQAISDRCVNRSGIEVKPLYGPEDWSSDRHMADVGFPGQAPNTRGIHASMYRGRPWSPRMVVGFGVPEDYNERMRYLYDKGLTGLFISPCNSHLRGYDPDEVDRELLGTCGTLITTYEDMDLCLSGVPFDKESISVGDTAPYTLTAMLLKVASDRAIPRNMLSGTTNQSDYLSHFAALHMFYRLALPGQKRVLLDHIDWMNQNVPKWNPISIVGQHTQQAGATPAESMGFAISSAIQYANDLVARGKEPDSFLPRFSFFFDVSTSFFEEIAKFRAARRIWGRIVHERFGTKNPRAQRFRFHVQTSGADLTRQQPLNNIARVTVHAMAGILGGVQSLHTDSYDEALGIPTESSVQIAIATQHILRDEARLADVIDPLGGSYYVETLTNQMDEEIMSVIRKIDDEGGMYAAVESGFVQKMIGVSSLDFQNKVESGENIVVGVNAFTSDGGCDDLPSTLERPSAEKITAYLSRLSDFRANRSALQVKQALDDLSKAFETETANTYEMIVNAASVGVTHGEICHRVRELVGFGNPVVMV